MSEPVFGDVVRESISFTPLSEMMQENMALVIFRSVVGPRFIMRAM
jgi:hypothetical protein